MSNLKIAIGSDHGGFLLKEAIRKYFDDNKIFYEDFGTFSEESVDYPIFALKVAKEVASNSFDFGILCCGTGIGISIAANKVKKIRAAVCNDKFSAEMSRRHNNANVLCLGGRIITKEKAIDLVNVFLNTEFDAGRHLKRIEQIKKIENENLL